MAYSDEVLADSPLLYWKLDETTGATTAADASGNGRAGTLNGAWNLQQTPSHVTDSTYAYTSGGGNIVSPTISFGSSDVTVEIWLYVDASQTYIPFSFGTNYLDIYITGGRIGINTGAGDQYGCTITTGYHHIVAVMPNNKATTNGKIYVDGSLQTLSGTSGTAPSISSTTFQVSGWSANGSYRIPNGYYVDAVSVYAGELSAGRIATHFSTGAVPSSAQVEANYVEAMTTTTPPVQVEANYVEALTAGGAVSVQVEANYVEAMTAMSNPTVQVETNYLEVLQLNPMAQIETVYAEALATANPDAQVEVVYAEALAAGTPEAQVEIVYTEALINAPRMQTEGVYAEALISGLSVMQTESVYAETLLSGMPGMQTEIVYAETLVGGTPGMRTEATYLEVLTESFPVIPFIGWGLAL